MSVEIFDNLHYKLKYEFVPRRRVVFNLGDIGKKFYTILKGSVYILLKKTGLEPSAEDVTLSMNLEDETLDKKRENVQKKIVKAQTGNDSFLKEIKEITDENYIDAKYHSFLIMRTMKNGESFGEVALRQNVARQFFASILL